MEEENQQKRQEETQSGCLQRHSCKLEKHIYSAKSAQKDYEIIRSESRQGIAITPEELKRIDAIITPLVKLGQSIHMICVNNADDIMLDEKTIYNYIDAGLLSVDNVILPRKVRYRTRFHKKPVRVDKQCYVGRTYEDFETYSCISNKFVNEEGEKQSMSVD